MRVAVSNSGPLIHLTLAGLLDFVFELFDLIIIPPQVYEEIVVKGKEQSHSDAYILERAVNKELIKIKAVKNGDENITSSKLHKAEIDTIKLYLQSDFETILLDDEEARVFARKLGIKVSGTLGILVTLYKNGLFGFSEVLQYLKKINEIMYLSSDVYCYIEKVLTEISQAD
ncbi:hypothetical protein LCGC14_0925010 [marine sediment metagenome]|uniref:DUF3368 domain-containing protein n=1 Tax=marine sediment metagenome TaxID=412755 RepID=A0A0F9NUH6_9ZZZZ